MRKLLSIVFILVIIGMLWGCSKEKSVQTVTPEISQIPETTKVPISVSTQTPEEVLAESEEPNNSEMPVYSDRVFVNDKAVIYGMTEDILENMSLEEKIGQLFIVNFELLDKKKGNYYEFRKLTKQMKKNIEKYSPGGVIFFARNIETREQTIQFVEDLQKVSKYPLFISVDEEGGEVTRIAQNDNMYLTKFPNMEKIGKTENEEYAYNMGATIGKEIAQLGFNLNFAPVTDVKTNELNTEIGSRSFGNEPKEVAKYVKQVVKGLQDENVSATLKHFPGQGDTEKDSHNGAVNVENNIERLRKIDFVPFKAGIKAGADFIMVSHISISKVTENTLPASLCPLVMQEILRKELGFNGIIITDAMDMKAITKNYSAKKAAIAAIKAGADIVLMPDNLEGAYKGILKEVKKGRIKESRIDESVRKILAVKIKRGIIPQDSLLLNQKKVDNVTRNKSF